MAPLVGCVTLMMPGAEVRHWMGNMTSSAARNEGQALFGDHCLTAPATWVVWGQTIAESVTSALFTAALVSTAHSAVAHD